MPYIPLNLNLGSIIWLNPSKKLLSYRKYFFVPWKDLPRRVRHEFEHHSHTHPDATVTSGLKSHKHADKTSQVLSCAGDRFTHYHSVLVWYADSHAHDFTVSFAASNLGTPWDNHTHVCSATLVTNGGAAHVHGDEGLEDFCDYDGCLDNPHAHAGSDSASGGAAHNDHTITFSTGTASGTPEAHTHSFSNNSESGGSHAHSSVGSLIANNTCYRGYNHGHTVSGTLVSITHFHAVSGTSGSGGEALPPTVAAYHGDGLTWITA